MILYILKISILMDLLIIITLYCNYISYMHRLLVIPSP
uniref:CPXV160 protein n=1 Tax=Heterorhabditis bacteriophora TaxID=37862 RepID=A0A1I7WSL0_HETBA